MALAAIGRVGGCHRRVDGGRAKPDGRRAARAGAGRRTGASRIRAWPRQFAYPAIALGQQIQFAVVIDSEASANTWPIAKTGYIYEGPLFAIKDQAYVLDGRG